MALLLAALLLIQVSIISAQENAPQGGSAAESETESQEAVRNPYQGESEIFLDTGAPAGQSSSRQPVWPIIRMILVLVLVAAAIYGLIFIFKRTSKKIANNDPFLKVLAAAHLGSNRYVHIVSAGNKTWLLGATDGGVNLIGEIEDKELIDAMLLEDSKKAAQSAVKLPDFLSLLRRAGAPAKTENAGAEEIRKHRERLGGL